MFSFLRKPQRKIRNFKNHYVNAATVAIISGCVVFMTMWRLQVEALPSIVEASPLLCRETAKVRMVSKSAGQTIKAPLMLTFSLLGQSCSSSQDRCYALWEKRAIKEKRQTHSPAPVVSSLRRFTRGQVLYLQHCADCHGWEGQGDGPLKTILASKPPVLRQEVRIFAHNSDTQIVERILSGTPFRPLQVDIPPYSATEITSLVVYLQQMPTISWEEVERGKGVYDSLCAACHGLYGRGDGLGARSFAAALPDLADPVYQQEVNDETLIRSITDGKGAMPGAGDILTAHEIRAVVTFLRVLSPGHELYSRFCAYCHGTDGMPVTKQPVQTNDTAISLLPSRFDTSYFRTHSVDQIRYAIPHMRRKPRPTMPHLARQLSADEALEIVRYLRTLTATQ